MRGVLHRRRATAILRVPLAQFVRRGLQNQEELSGRRLRGWNRFFVLSRASEPAAASPASDGRHRSCPTLPPESPLGGPAGVSNCMCILFGDEIDGSGSTHSGSADRGYCAVADRGRASGVQPAGRVRRRRRGDPQLDCRRGTARTPNLYHDVIGTTGNSVPLRRRRQKPSYCGEPLSPSLLVEAFLGRFLCRARRYAKNALIWGQSAASVAATTISLARGGRSCGACFR